MQAGSSEQPEELHISTAEAPAVPLSPEIDVANILLEMSRGIVIKLDAHRDDIDTDLRIIREAAVPKVNEMDTKESEINKQSEAEVKRSPLGQRKAPKQNVLHGVQNRTIRSADAKPHVIKLPSQGISMSEYVKENNLTPWSTLVVAKADRSKTAYRKPGTAPKKTGKPEQPSTAAVAEPTPSTSYGQNRPPSNSSASSSRSDNSSSTDGPEQGDVGVAAVAPAAGDVPYHANMVRKFVQLKPRSHEEQQKRDKNTASSRRSRIKAREAEQRQQVDERRTDTALTLAITKLAKMRAHVNKLLLAVGKAEVSFTGPRPREALLRQLSNNAVALRVNNPAEEDDPGSESDSDFKIVEDDAAETD